MKGFKKLSLWISALLFGLIAIGVYQPEKLLFFTALAVLAGCVKENHIQYDNHIDDEITFVPAPVVRASNSTFASTSVFQTGAFHHVAGTLWVFSYFDSAEYIPETVVSRCGDDWRMERSVDGEVYRWPAGGDRLTFFSWSLNSETLSFHPASGSRRGQRRTIPHRRSFTLHLSVLKMLRKPVIISRVSVWTASGAKLTDGRRIQPTTLSTETIPSHRLL